MCMKKSLLLRIRVCVFQGDCVELAEAGAPIPVCLQMQQLELSLGKEQWSTRQTCGGFSVFFFFLPHVAGRKREERQYQEEEQETKKVNEVD